MGSTTIMTVRIAPELLSALKKWAKREGRSVSAEVVRLIAKEVEPVPIAQPRRTMGMFSEFEAPDLDDFMAVRRLATAALRRRSRMRQRGAP
jgi:hypothetical protein